MAMTMKKRKESEKAKKDMNHVVAGVDLGDSESLTTLLSPDGDVVKAFSFSMGDDGMALFAENVPRDARITIEATLMAYPLSRSLRSLGYSDITVAHPTESAWIVRPKKKNGRADSLKIARLHLARMLPESHLLDKDEQIGRDLLIQRVKSGQAIGKTKTIMVSYLKREGVYSTLPQTSRAFSLAKREAMQSRMFNDDRDLVIGSTMEKLEFLEKQSVRFEERIKVLVRESEDVKLLMTIPGVDHYLASLISSYIRDVNRFPDSDHLASFFGMNPESKDSSRVKRRGKMSKDGPSIARWALSIMVDTVMKTDPHTREYYQHQKDRLGSGALAHVKTMKKLLRMVDHMLRTGEHGTWGGRIVDGEEGPGAGEERTRRGR